MSGSIFISTLAFVAVFLFCIGVFQYIRQYSGRRELVGKIQEGTETWGAADIEDLSKKIRETEKKPVTEFLNVLGQRLIPDQSEYESRMRSKFLKAGLRRANMAVIFWGAKCFLAIFLLIGFLLLRFTLIRQPTLGLTLVLCLLLTLAGFYLPEIWLNMKISRRREKIFKGLPDALDILVVCVEAGMGLDAAINRVGEEIKMTNKPLSEELKLYNLELRAGKSRQDALKNLSVRTDLEDMNSLVTLLIQTDKFGTSIAQALRVYSDSFRTKRFMRAEEIAAKLPVKLVVPLILFIFPALFVAILGPALIRVFQTFIHR